MKENNDILPFMPTGQQMAEVWRGRGRDTHAQYRDQLLGHLTTFKRKKQSTLIENELMSQEVMKTSIKGSTS